MDMNMNMDMNTAFTFTFQKKDGTALAEQPGPGTWFKRSDGLKPVMVDKIIQNKSEATITVIACEFEDVRPYSVDINWDELQLGGPGAEHMRLNMVVEKVTKKKQRNCRGGRRCECDGYECRKEID
jgi:hypothetical protein